MASALVITPQHGFVLGTLATSFLVQNMWMGLQVGKARRKYKVFYPNLYADKDHPQADAFNCIQRGHQGTLEMAGSFHTLLLVAGLRFPIAASVAGLGYLIGRVMFFKGYSTGDPRNRMRGALYALSMFSLVGMTATWAVQLLTKL